MLTLVQRDNPATIPVEIELKITAAADEIRTELFKKLFTYSRAHG